MPVSKHRRKKPRATPPVTAAPQVPTRRMREAYVAKTSPEERAAALAEAEAIMARGLESKSARICVTAAYKALALSPLCADAYCLLAEETTREEEDFFDYYKRGIHAAELALGPEGFERHAGSFWSVPETKPYMKAVYGLVEMLLEYEREEEAVPYLETMLRLNPADDQGARYMLLAYYLDQHDLEPARALLHAFEHEHSTAWLYSRVLLAYRDEQQSAPSTLALVEAALAANRHVPGILAEEEEDEFGASPFDRGSAEEATDYVIRFEDAWLNAPGSIAWLLSKSRRARA